MEYRSSQNNNICTEFNTCFKLKSSETQGGSSLKATLYRTATMDLIIFINMHEMYTVL